MWHPNTSAHLRLERVNVWAKRSDPARLESIADMLELAAG